MSGPVVFCIGQGFVPDVIRLATGIRQVTRDRQELDPTDPTLLSSGRDRNRYY